MHSNPQHKNSGKLCNAQDRFDRIENSSSIRTMAARLIIRQNVQAALLARLLKRTDRKFNRASRSIFGVSTPVKRPFSSAKPRGRL
jgi:hypothetical protein